jgi:uncharacterized protein YifN (PemK superfamily)
MPITFTPRRSAILMCNFERSFVPPEMRKRRRVIVISPTAHNRWTANNPGTCTVVPLSATAPYNADPRNVLIPIGRYASLTADVWSKCGMIATVSNSRLDRVLTRGTRQGEYANVTDMAAIEAAIAAALDLP